MSEVARIADQLRRSFEGGAWHGPAIVELLKGVTAAQAAAKPLSGAHSIWELVLHIAAWKRAVRRRLEGKATEVSPEDNFPVVRDASAAAWRQAQQRLADAHRELEEAVAALPESRLDEIAPGRDHTIYFMLHGQVQHTLYHAGQIAVLKKAKGA